MIYKHNRSGELYRVLLDSFSVERQERSIVYMQLSSGDIFDRGAVKFYENFTYQREAQLYIVPKAPHP